MTAIWRDIRFGLRILTKSPGFTLVAIGTLALGIGATTAIFSVVNAVMLRPLPYRDSSRLVVPATVFARHGTDRGSVSYPDFLDWKNQTDLFDSVAVFGVRSRVITGGEQPERIRCGSVSDDYFRVMAAPPLLGRTFTPQENAPGAGNVVVLSYGLWMRRFGGDAKVLGSKIDLDGVPHTIVGVMPKNSQWPEEAEAWGPIGFGSNPPQGIMRRDDHEFQAVARLRAGVYHRAVAGQAHRDGPPDRERFCGLARRHRAGSCIGSTAGWWGRKCAKFCWCCWARWRLCC